MAKGGGCWSQSPQVAIDWQQGGRAGPATVARTQVRAPQALAFAALLQAGVCAAPSAVAHPNCAEGAAAEAEIRELEAAGARSNVDGMSATDAAAMFADDYLSIGPDGSRSDRATVLRFYQPERSTPWASRFEIESLEVRVYCEAALVIGLASAESVGADARSARFRWLNLWHREAAGWKLVASQFARFDLAAAP